MSKDRERFAAVVGRLAPRAQLEHHWPLIGGISADVQALAFRHQDGRRETVVVRQLSDWLIEPDPQIASREFSVLKAVYSAGVLAPEPLYYEESGGIFPLPYLVMRYVDGQPEFSPTDKADYAQQLAEQLARIHGVGPHDHELSLLPRQPYWVERSLSESRQQNYDESIEEHRIVEFLRSVWPLPAVNPVALLHGDIWPGNLIWRDGRLAAVIDWEVAYVGEPLTDLSVTRLDMLWAFGWETMEIFTAAYFSLTSLDHSQLPYWDLVAAIRPAHELSEWATQWPIVGRPDISSATMRRDQREFADRALAAAARLS